MIRPTARIASAGDESGQLEGGVLAQRDEIDRLAPRCRFLSAPGCRYLADYARQYIGRMLPADEVKTLERLVDEIERVSAIVKGFGCRPVEIYPPVVGPASESLRGRNPRGLVGGLPSMGI